MFPCKLVQNSVEETHWYKEYGSRFCWKITALENGLEEIRVICLIGGYIINSFPSGAESQRIRLPMQSARDVGFNPSGRKISGRSNDYSSSPVLWPGKSYMDSGTWQTAVWWEMELKTMTDRLLTCRSRYIQSQENTIPLFLAEQILYFHQLLKAELLSQSPYRTGDKYQ